MNVSSLSLSPSPSPHLDSSLTLAPREREYFGATDIDNYEFLRKLGEGTFGEVWKCRTTSKSRYPGRIVALKKIIVHSEKYGFPITAVREIRILKKLQHRNILHLLEVALKKSGLDEKSRPKVTHYMVTPYMEHDLSGLLDNPKVHLSLEQIKSYMLQLCDGIAYLHDNQIMHRDIKAANLLISNRGILQIADFGLARNFLDAPPVAGRYGYTSSHEYTGLVVTRWYRSPELLLGLRQYTTAIDMWGVGCVFGEMIKRQPILSGSGDMSQLNLIFDLVGSPTNTNMPGWDRLGNSNMIKKFQYRPGNINSKFCELDSAGLDFLKRLLTLDWRKRIHAIDALEHDWFWRNPLPARPQDLPRFEDSHELDRRALNTEATMPPAPLGGEAGGIRPNYETFSENK